LRRAPVEETGSTIPGDRHGYLGCHFLTSLGFATLRALIKETGSTIPGDRHGQLGCHFLTSLACGSLRAPCGR
jgi:hypothetical protein